MASSLEQYVRQAKNGDRQALETVVCRIQDKIYGLVLRMLSNPDDAEDEAQEIQKEGPLLDGVKKAIAEHAGEDAAKMVVAAAAFEVTETRPLVVMG